MNIVKVMLPEPGSKSNTALVYNKDRTILLRWPASQVSRRFSPGEKVAFFKYTEDKAAGIIDIDDRVPNEAW